MGAVQSVVEKPIIETSPHVEIVEVKKEMEEIKKPVIESVKKEVKEICSICLEDLYQPLVQIEEVKTVECGHKFHKCCINEVMTDKCPLCRKDINKEEVSARKTKEMEKLLRELDERVERHRLRELEERIRYQARLELERKNEEKRRVDALIVANHVNMLRGMGYL